MEQNSNFQQGKVLFPKVFGLLGVFMYQVEN